MLAILALSICFAHAPLVVAAPTGPTFERSYAEARERALQEEKPLFVALLAEGEPRSLALADALRSRALAPWLEQTVNVVGELATGSGGRRQKGFDGVTIDELRAIVPELRAELLASNDEGVIAVPQVVWLTHRGEVLASVPYELAPEELAWSFAFARTRAQLPNTVELPDDARPPRRLLGDELYRPADGDAYGRGMTSAELEEEIDRRRSTPFGAGAVASWLRILFTDEEEAVELAEVELSRGMLGWLRGDRMNQTIDYIGTVSPAEFWSVLAPFAKDDEEEVRLRTAAAFEQLGAPDALKTVTSALKKEKDGDARRAWMRALGACGRDDKGARKKLLALLDAKREDALVHRTALYSLGYLALDEELRALLHERLAAEDEDDRQAAAYALTVARDTASIAAIEACLKGAEDPDAREGLGLALMILRGDASLAGLQDHVQRVTRDDHPRYRIFFLASPPPLGGGR